MVGTVILFLMVWVALNIVLLVAWVVLVEFFRRD